MLNIGRFMFNDAEFIDVETGEVKISKEPIILRSLAIGSCIVVVAFDQSRKIGGLAHIMLPGRCQSAKEENKMKYAEDAIDGLLNKLEDVGVKRGNLEISLIGGADIIGDREVPSRLTDSVLDYLKSLNIAVMRQRLGGTQHRSITLDIKTGEMLFSEGDSVKKEF